MKGGDQDRDAEHARSAAILRQGPTTDPEGVVGAWFDVRARLPVASPFLEHWESTWSEIQACPDPELALAIWTRFVEAAEADPRVGEASGSPPSGEFQGRMTPRREELWARSGAYREGFIQVAGSSPALGELLLKLWPRFQPDSWQTGWVTRENLERRLLSVLEIPEDAEFLDEIRRFQRLESIRIAYLDCVQELPVEQVTLQISRVADAVIDACTQRAIRAVSTRLRRVPPARGFLVLALGKLGGMELNYSSDVDLNFVYDDTLPFLENKDGSREDDRYEIDRFFTLVGERLVQYMTAFTEFGQLYRLDTRLRPGGSVSRLVWSARSSVDYYYSSGRAWERQALIRMRPVTGDPELAGMLLRELEAFVFPTSFTTEEIQEIRGLKLQVEKMAAKRGHSETQIKIGRGGIRDVEYIVQYLQLVHALRIAELRASNIFQALEVLDRVGLLKAEETDVLRRGYRFLRRVEHRIQMADMLQSHRLPEDPRALLRLARGLGFPTVESFRGRLARHSASIRRVYGLLFEEATVQRKEHEALPALLGLPISVAAEEGAGLVAPFGFKRPGDAFCRLHELSNPGSGPIQLDAHRTREVFGKLVGKLLREISLQPDPDRVLWNFEHCVRALGARSVFYELLNEDPRILQLFVDICARSTLVVEILRAYPEVFDEVVDCMLTGYEFPREALAAGVASLVASSSELERDLFKLKYLHLLLIAVRDLTGRRNLGSTLFSISELCESLFEGVLESSLQKAHAEMGAWTAEAPRFVVLGLGRLGGQEMGYRSDLNLMLIYSGSFVTSTGVSTDDFFGRLERILLESCGVADTLGPLLAVDLRLRPMGIREGILVSLDDWRRHFQGADARTWERQAFLRARPIAGDTELGAEVMEFIRTEMVLGGVAGPSAERAALYDVWELRADVERHASSDDLKKGAGGILDVEFLVQALQLCRGRRQSEVLHPNVPEALRRLHRAGALDEDSACELLTSYQFLRSFENRLALLGEASGARGSVPEGELESLVQKIGYRSTGEETALSIFRSELEFHKGRNRWHLRRVLGKD